MTNELWVPSGTQILTVEGWANVEYVYHTVVELMTINLLKKAVERQVISRFSSLPYQGDLTTIKADGLRMVFKSAAPVAKEEFLLGWEETLYLSHKLTRDPFKGELFNFKVKNETVILRNPLPGCSVVSALLSGDEYDQDAYEVSESLDWTCSYEALSNQKSAGHYSENQMDMSKHRVAEEVNPDYWVSRTSW